MRYVYENRKKANSFTEQDGVDFKLHKRLLTTYYLAKEKDKKIRSEDTAVLIFDLQNVKVCPRLDVQDLYYYRKLKTYNLTGQVLTLSDGHFAKQSHCVVWHQCLAGRGGGQ